VRITVTAAVILMLSAGAATGAPVFSGELKSDYYLYQDAAGNDRFIFTQTIGGRFAPPSWRGWEAAFQGEHRDANSGLPGTDESRLLGLTAAGPLGSARLALGRLMIRAGGFSLVDGLEATLPASVVKLTVAAGREVYPIRRVHTSGLPERYRAGFQAQGKFESLNWQIDHASRFLRGDLDDQTTGLSLRCRRFALVNWDARLNYDMASSQMREGAFGLRVMPSRQIRLDLRYSERRMRAYRDYFLHSYTLEPTRLASLKASYHCPESGFWYALGFTHRFREEGDLERLTASVANDHAEMGVRLQSGTGMNNFGGWLDASGELIPRLGWSAGIDFDRWDSAWDSEETEAWANYAGLSYELSPVTALEGKLEHYRDEYVESDVRGLITFKLRYGL